MVKIPKIKKQHAALLIITIISILVVVTLVRNGNKTEEYDTGKVKEDLIDYIKEKEGEFDFDKLPEGIYFFSGQEGFVKIEVNKDGHQSWDLQNWFASLDPDKDEAQHQKTIEDIKKRLNADTGIINPSKKQEKRNFLNIFSQ